MTNPNRSRMDPARREHFVYRAFAEDGTLLYVGCTMNLTTRRAEHQSTSQWYAEAVSFKLVGPFNYDTGRRLEREAIRSEFPLWNCDEPHRMRVRAMRARIFKRWHSLYLGLGESTVEAIHAAARRADSMVPKGSERAGIHVSPTDVALAEGADIQDQRTHAGLVPA